MGTSEHDDVIAGKTCITPDCGEPARWKGICSSCYGAAKKLIDADKTSWEELIEMGLAVTKHDKFLLAFKAKQEEMKKITADITPGPDNRLD